MSPIAAVLMTIRLGLRRHHFRPDLSLGRSGCAKPRLRKEPLTNE
jgi:hypothetical protein